MNTADYYNECAEVFDLWHQDDKDDVGFWKGLAYEAGAKSVLELGIGTGRVGIRLAAQGLYPNYSVTGIDVSSAMLERCRLKLDRLATSVENNLELVEADMRDFVLGKQFDHIYCTLSAFSHLLTTQDQQQALGQIKKHMHEKSLLAIDLFMPDYEILHRAGIRPGYNWRETRMGAEDERGAFQLERVNMVNYNKHSQLMNMKVVWYKLYAGQQETSLNHILDVRVVFPQELKLLLQSSGFEVESMCGDYFGGKITSESRRIIYLARLA